MKTRIVDFEVLSRIAGERRSYAAGDVIFEAGSRGDEFFVIRRGSVNIKVGERVVDTLGPSEVFGEMAIVDARPRSATVIAETDCLVVPVSEKQFVMMVREAPYFALAIMRVMAERLRVANAAIDA